MGEAQPLEIAKHSASTEPDFAVFSGEEGSFGPEKTAGVARPPGVAIHGVTAAVTIVANSVGVDDARPSEFAKYRAMTQSQNLLMLVKLGLLRLQSTEPRQIPNSQRLMVELGLLGSE